ncbi:MAG: bifunctional phosphopantothenoylcysteine decarboxylase/phosphopantothenate--cysteine ligase CoaBC [Deltaproteobacteria bacterium]|jgi:phosphopantothenoylcysteine decarboxylase/phosphopantothenate--cysteine ligase|nr:bifunctional phosphopantothenoylcysteine decarboxylase/phosphopantothenate--cysteine ligase CoaBC [Deltaproteobacteria bacterium]MBW2498892.1 bifunctional phosphopantothenoylcysteine decarboxylase/phosphopantothenate--cysteine ligase CoaBC [Deltaproteobacteria bacterium]
MAPRRILLAISGGIAAYKTPELVRALRAAGHDVRCILTPEAERFVAPLSLQTVSGHAVRCDLFDASEEGEIDHIGLADWAELVLVAPATANLMAKATHGLADELVSAVLLATRAPILMAPAMNVNMWSHPATQANLELLRSRGIRFVGPESGELACGWEGLGRMSDPAVIAAAAESQLSPQSLAGERVLVTAGGTAESIDAVRALTNRSSGKMGFAIATEAAARGAEVVLVAGVTDQATPFGVRRVDVRSALEMRDVVLAELPAATIVVKAAAVADFRPRFVSDRKIKKEALAEGESLTLELIENPDILQEVSARRGDRTVVGFAAESHDVIAAARRKLERKGCDLIVANDISRSDAGFEVDENAVLFVWPNGELEELPLLPKQGVAAQLFDRIEKLRESR